MTHVAKVLLKAPNQQYLLLTRSDHPTFPNDPDLPGGTVEEGEDVPIAAVREVEEEAGIRIDPSQLKHVYTGSDYSKHGTIYTLYAADISRKPEVTISWEHAGYEWLTLEELLSRAKVAADTYMRMVYARSR